MIPRYLFCTKHLNLPPLVLHHAHLIRVLLGGKVCLWHNTTFLGRQKLGTTMAFFGETSLGAVIFCISSSIFDEFVTFLNLHCGKSRPDQRINSARTSAICTQEVPGWSDVLRSKAIPMSSYNSIETLSDWLVKKTQKKSWFSQRHFFPRTYGVIFSRQNIQFHNTNHSNLQTVFPETRRVKMLHLWKYHYINMRPLVAWSFKLG